MPTVKDEQGNVVAKLPYDDTGEAQAEKMVSANTGFEVDYAPGGEVNAAERSVTQYPGGGKTGYDVPQYAMGGKAMRGAGRAWRREGLGVLKKMSDRMRKTKRKGHDIKLKKESEKTSVKKGDPTPKTGYVGETKAKGTPGLPDKWQEGGHVERYKEKMTAKTRSEKRDKIKQVRQSQRRVKKSARAYQKDKRTSGDLTRNERKSMRDFRRTSRKEKRANVKSIRKTGMTIGSREVYKALKSDKFPK